MQSVSKSMLIATFQLSSAASLNLGRSQNGVLGNGLIDAGPTLHMQVTLKTFPIIFSTVIIYTKTRNWSYIHG